MASSLEETVDRARLANPGALPRDFSERVLDRVRMTARNRPVIVSSAGLVVTFAASVVVAAVLSWAFGGSELSGEPPALTGFSTNVPILSP